MGIKGLLPLLKSIHRPAQLNKFSGETFGVDAYGWLHRGAISCAIELAEGKPTRGYVDFAMKIVRMVMHFGVTPYMVFDGDFLPSKASTEASRLESREKRKALGIELLKAGKPSQAHQELQKAIDVTPEMARHLIEALKRAGVPYVVAPYEADAQMVYLERQGIISGIISEDSDLLIFGAKRLITKLNHQGQCVEINRRDFGACREVSLTSWTDESFRHMGILSGCDYLSGLPGMGLKTAHRMLRKHRSPERVVRMLQFEGKSTVPANYLTLFKQAEQTFLYQWVFCPTAKKLVNLTPLPDGVDLEQLPFIGGYVEPELAQKIASGEYNPMTKEMIPMTSLPSPRKRTASAADRSVIRPTQRPREPPTKPIDAYFKGHRRIALGEMDPNCFVPDPNRSSTATDEGARPVVFPLPRPYIDGTNPVSSGTSRAYIQRPDETGRTLRRRTEPISNLLANGGTSLASESRRRTAGPAIRAPSQAESASVQSGHRPLKKARLCEDASSGSSPRKERSKFFSPKSIQSPRTKKGDLYLMSDDSIEEALKDLPDVDEWSSSTTVRKSISVYEESTQTSLSNDRTGHDSVVPDTPPKSSLNRFVYAPDAAIPETSQPKRRSQRPSSMSSTRSSLLASTPMSTTSQTSTAMTTPATPRLSPLERLGIQAISRGKASPTPTFVKPRQPKRSSLGRMSLDTIPVNPAFVPLPPVDKAEKVALNESVGSEDLLVPDSESEDVENSPQVVARQGKAGLDLSRFRLSYV
ncbi:hypothetical protein GGR57DRAFT_236427 [Xylariaceae sp. FL1272]|nr:hypothetical protein GGR57DRAFT_236427 [Xylariaceae sp. FL1272]